MIEMQILDFLAELHDPAYELDIFVEISVYGGALFPNVAIFKTWWILENITLQGYSPMQIADTVTGRDQILRHLREMFYLQEKPV